MDNEQKSTKKEKFNLSEALNEIDLTRGELGLFREIWKLESDVLDENVVKSIKEVARRLDGENKLMAVVLMAKPEIGTALVKVQVKLKEINKANTQ